LPDLEGYVTDLTGRALEWHSRGQRFDPAYLHQKDLKSKDFRSLFAYNCIIRPDFQNLFWMSRNSCFSAEHFVPESYQNCTRMSMVLKEQNTPLPLFDALKKA